MNSWHRAFSSARKWGGEPDLGIIGTPNRPPHRAARVTPTGRGGRRHPTPGVSFMRNFMGPGRSTAELYQRTVHPTREPDPNCSGSRCHPIQGEMDGRRLLRGVPGREPEAAGQEPTDRTEVVES